MQCNAIRYVTLHYITIHHITSHYITSHHITYIPYTHIRVYIYIMIYSLVLDPELFKTPFGVKPEPRSQGAQPCPSAWMVGWHVG